MFTLVRSGLYTVFDLYRPRVTPMFTLVRSGLYTVFYLYRPRVTPMFTLVRSGLFTLHCILSLPSPSYAHVYFSQKWVVHCI